MASPWITHQQPQRPPTERPWMGMAMLVAVPLLSLILIRMLWSGSSLWFLTVGIILLGAAAVVFLARRPQDEYGRQLAPESSRLPLVLAGLGVLFLALLLLPNFADSSSGGKPSTALQQQQSQPSTNSGSQSSTVNHQPTQAVQQQAVQQQPTAVQQQSQTTSEPADTTTTQPVVQGETYTVQDGDTLWDIADTHGTSVEAIVAANSLDSPDDIQVDQELVIPPADDTSTADATPVENPAPVGAQ